MGSIWTARVSVLPSPEKPRLRENFHTVLVVATETDFEIHVNSHKAAPRVEFENSNLEENAGAEIRIPQGLRGLPLVAWGPIPAGVISTGGPQWFEGQNDVDVDEVPGESSSCGAAGKSPSRVQLQCIIDCA